jgi:hypothetical protein
VRSTWTDFDSLFVPRLSPQQIEVGEQIDNPHTCILDDDVRCLTCALIDVLGEDRREEALDIAAAIVNERLDQPKEQT